MKAYTLLLLWCIWWSFGCGDHTKLTTMTDEQVNELLAQVNANDPSFTQKDIAFDSIVTAAGTRTVEEKSERVKFKLFYFGDLVRGYYNLADRDDKNLQVFGKKIKDHWVLKCVTKIEMTEADGYVIIKDSFDGIWSNGSVNFKKGILTTSKQNIDYTELQNW